MQTKTIPPCLAAALEYLARGWSAIPLCPPDHAGCSPAHVAGCKSAGKAPMWPWKTYQERLPSERELRIYWSRNIHCNVGVVLGSVSGLVGIDADGPDADAILRELSFGDLPPTASFNTPGGGRRLLYQIPKGVVIPKRRYDRGASHVIILGEGSQTVMPPSVHASGKEYQWP
jgi:hypothetical protein